jgi:hypothetical protein
MKRLLEVGCYVALGIGMILFFASEQYWESMIGRSVPEGASDTVVVNDHGVKHRVKAAEYRQFMVMIQGGFALAFSGAGTLLYRKRAGGSRE